MVRPKQIEPSVSVSPTRSYVDIPEYALWT